jgi:uncharacterized protein
MPAATTPGARAPRVASAIDDLVNQARAHYERAMQAQRDGNWALYGEEIKRLGEVLERIAAQR